MAAVGEPERPILVVSNRLPVTVQLGARGIERRRSIGGLVSPLDPVLTRRGGKNTLRTIVTDGAARNG